MKIKYVTMTGADDNTSIQDMLDISRRYPFAEWGILFSQSKGGVARYPSFDWIEELWDACGMEMNLSAHLCGKWVSDIMQFGKLTFLNGDESEIFSRVQLNMGKDRLVQALDANKKSHELIWEAISGQHVILGGAFTEVNFNMDPRSFFLNEVSILFDASGGRGQSPSEWPHPIVVNDTPLFCGYAGGLCPDNLEQELERISKACEVVEARTEPEIWIDAESGLRNKDEFDLEKCEQFLKIAEPWTK